MTPSIRHCVTSVTVEIDAPAAFVWEVLVDYASYPEWNPYTIAVETTLEIGDRIDLTLPNPDGSEGTMLNREFIRIVDPPHHLRYDTGEEYPGLLGMRDQYVTELGPDRCQLSHDGHAQWRARRPGHGDERRLDQGRLRRGGRRAEVAGRAAAGHPMTPPAVRFLTDRRSARIPQQTRSGRLG